MIRCEWVPADGPDVAYHDDEWGVPSHDDRRLYEMLTLEGAQAGLSWATILRKRDGYRAAFANFDAAKVARFTDSKAERLLEDPGIVRNRLKVASTIDNAKAVLAVTEEFGSLAAFLWGFVDGEPITNAFHRLSDIPAETPTSKAMSKELKRRGFRFVGPTICYAFMQAVGMVNDHTVECFRYAQLSPAWEGPGLDAWDAWTPQQAAAALDGVGADWWVVGGWAIDLWLGETTRDHEDLEIAVLREDLRAVREHLSGCRVYEIGGGAVRELVGEAEPDELHHQNWVLEDGRWRLDVMIEPGDRTTWIARRDPRITAARSRVVTERDGIPYLRPEAVLLFKAKATRDKDEADFERVLPTLDGDARSWLADALRTVHPDHPWIARLS